MTEPLKGTAESLAGKRIAITGSTGFLGTALVERLIRSVPTCRLVLLVRPGKRSTPAERARREIFRNDAFDRLLEDRGKEQFWHCLLYTSPSPRDKRQSRMPSSA